MRSNFYMCAVTIFVTYGECLEYLQGWGYLGIHCRDNDNKPVDWWYLYKPPSELAPYLETGRNFSYITPATTGKWQPSDVYITATSMFQHTLYPLFKTTYKEHLAAVVYDRHNRTKDFGGSAAMGMLMSDEMGGVWLGHTVPGLPVLSKDKPTFPEDQLANGHLMMCLSLDIGTLNVLVNYIKAAGSKFRYVKIAKSLKPILPNWRFTNSAPKSLIRKVRKSWDFHTVDNTPVSLLVRVPGGRKCIYNRFAKLKHIILDVYGRNDQERLKSMCGRDYGVRSIKAISLKLTERVTYIRHKVDYARFAVSTAAHWQRTGSSGPQYWTCTSNLDKEDRSGLGGLLLCVQSYNVWVKFDNFKVKEPEC